MGDKFAQAHVSWGRRRVREMEGGRERGFLVASGEYSDDLKSLIVSNVHDFGFRTSTLILTCVIPGYDKTLTLAPHFVCGGEDALNSRLRQYRPVHPKSAQFKAKLM